MPGKAVISGLRYELPLTRQHEIQTTTIAGPTPSLKSTPSRLLILHPLPLPYLYPTHSPLDDTITHATTPNSTKTEKTKKRRRRLREEAKAKEEGEGEAPPKKRKKRGEVLEPEKNRKTDGQQRRERDIADHHVSRVRYSGGRRRPHRGVPGQRCSPSGVRRQGAAAGEAGIFPFSRCRPRDSAGRRGKDSGAGGKDWILPRRWGFDGFPGGKLLDRLQFVGSGGFHRWGRGGSAEQIQRRVRFDGITRRFSPHQARAVEFLPRQVEVFRKPFERDVAGASGEAGERLQQAEKNSAGVRLGLV